MNDPVKGTFCRFILPCTGRFGTDSPTNAQGQRIEGLKIGFQITAVIDLIVQQHKQINITVRSRFPTGLGPIKDYPAQTTAVPGHKAKFDLLQQFISGHEQSSVP